MSATLEDFASLAANEEGLAIVSTMRGDQTIQASLVNVGRLAHPLTDDEVVAFVTYGKIKLANLRQRSQVTITVRSKWQWATVEGAAEIIGPDDVNPAIDDEALRVLLRDIFKAAGGTHEDWHEYDRVMREQRRAAVFVRPQRIYSN